MTRPAVMIFWDYDTQWGGDRSRSGRRRQYGHADFENTTRLLDLHSRYDVPACFAVVGAAALPGSRPYHDPRQIRAIHRAGHEVGSHSYRHEWLPALDRAALRATLSASKDALEQCIGAPVTTFVPPFNQPFDYPAGLSFSLSERRQAGPERTGLSDLCEGLRDTGYRFCRVAYRSIFRRAADRLAGRRVDAPEMPKRIHGVWCMRLNTDGGFIGAAEAIRRESRSGIWVAYGHPHSITEDGPQSVRCLEVFLRTVRELRREAALDCVLPRDWLAAESEPVPCDYMKI